MNKLRTTILLGVMMLALVAAGVAQAQGPCPAGAPPTPAQVAEINATHGAALWKFCPQYAAVTIPVTGNAFYFRHHAPPTAGMIAEINQTHGVALLNYWKR